MAGAIKGITIEFRGNTSSLDQALNKVKKEAKNTSNELKYIDKALKFNPTSVDAWRQKQIVLNKAIKETEEKLKVMKDGLREMQSQGLNAENSEEFRRMQREIDQTERHLKGLKAELRGIGNVKLKAASEQFKQWGKSLENAGHAMREVSMAAAAVTASIGALTVKSGKWADDLNTMSKRYGVGTQELQKYSLAADLVDTSTEAIVKSQTRLKKSMLSAEQGSANQAAAFEKLGIQVTNADGSLRDGEQVWQETISALGEMTNETERDALAMQLMGKSANELNPLIEDGGETYKRLSETMSKYGLDFIDQETLDQANQFNDELDTIKAIGLVTLQSLGTELAGYLAPALGKVVEAIGKFAQWLKGLNPEVLAIVAAVGAFVAALAPALIVLGKISTGIGALLGILAKLGGGLSAILGPVGAVIAVIGVLVAAFVQLWNTNEEFRAKVTTVWNLLRETVITFVEEVKSKFTELISIFTGGSGSIKEAWEAFCNMLAPAFEIAFSVIVTVVKSVLDAILATLDIFIAVFQGNWGAAWEGVKALFSAVWNAIVVLFKVTWTMILTIVKAQLTILRAVITTVFNALKTFIQNVWNAIKTAITNALNQARISVTNIVNGIRNTITSVFNTIKTTVSNIANNIKSTVTSAFTSLKSSVASTWNSIKTSITTPITNAFNTLKGIVSKIKGLFPISIGKIMSNLQLPRISIGSKSKTIMGKSFSVPTFDLSWYAQGGIFDSPTVLAGVGEAGPEAVIPLDRFWKTLENNNAKTDSILAVQNRILYAMLEELQKDKDFKIDGRVAGRIINDLVRV